MSQISKQNKSFTYSGSHNIAEKLVKVALNTIYTTTNHLFILNFLYYVNVYVICRVNVVHFNEFCAVF